jgi:3-hydroxyacyl-CoA dehydrogenase
MSIDRVYVIGAGLMGHGIAQVTAAAGKQVTLADRNA